MIGTVVSVHTAPAGVEVASDAPAGALSLAVVSALDLAETGGRVTLDGVALDYVAADHDSGTVTLAAPLSSPLVAGTFLRVDPPAPETVAVVEVASDEDDDPVLVDAVVPPELVPFLLREGVDDTGAGASVRISTASGSLVVDGLVEEPSSIHAHYIHDADELLLADMKTLGEKLSEAAAERAAAAGRLDAAEGLLGDAFSQIDVLPDQAYVDAAKQQAIDAAAIDAQTRAEAEAQQVQGNLDQAERDLQAAIASGDQNAIAQAQAKADAAKAAAIAAAAADATAKAEQAEADATAAAALDAQAKANAARDAAIAAAATDATAKADAAKAFATTQANGVAKSVWSTALPGTTRLPQNSTWYQHDSAGKVIAVFNQTAASSGTTHGNTWVARPIKSDAIDNLDVGKLTVAGSSTLQQAVINQMAVQLANIIKADIGNLTVTGDSNLNAVVAERIWGNIAAFAELTADRILSGFLQATIGIATGGSIVAGDPSGARVEMTADGFRVWVVGPSGSPYVAVEMINGKISFRVAGSDGSILASIGSDGSITGTSATFAKDPTIGGLPLMGQVGGGIVPGRMDILPRGVVPGSPARRTAASAQRAAGSHHTFLQSKATLHPGRLYQFVGTGVAMAGVGNGVVRWTVRWTTDGSTPNTSSPELAQVTGPQAYTGGVNFSQTLISDLFTVPVKTQARFVMTYQSLNGATPTATSARCFVEDKGPVSTEALLADGDAPTLYVTEWKASESRVYTKTGAPLAGGDGKVEVWNWTPTNTSNNSAILFGGGADIADNASELGKTMSTALSGATLLKSEVYLHSKIVYTKDYQPGPTALGTLGATALPASKVIDGSLYVPEVPSGGGVWVEVPTAWFTSGANQGITVGDKDAWISTPGGAVLLPSMFINGPDDANPPRVRHTYTR